MFTASGSSSATITAFDRPTDRPRAAAFSLSRLQQRPPKAGFGPPAPTVRGAAQQAQQASRVRTAPFRDIGQKSAKQKPKAERTKRGGQAENAKCHANTFVFHGCHSLVSFRPSSDKSELGYVTQEAKEKQTEKEKERKKEQRKTKTSVLSAGCEAKKNLNTALTSPQLSLSKATPFRPAKKTSE